MNSAAESPFIRVLVLWLAGGILALVYFNVLARLAPLVLERDRNTSVWYLNSLADEAWREIRELPADADPVQKAALLESAVSALKKAHQIRPDSVHHLWYLSLSQYQLAELQSPADPSLLQAALDGFDRVIVLTQRKWARPLVHLAHHYIRQGNDPEARKLFEEILLLEPRQLEAIRGLLQISYRAGDYAEYTRLYALKAEIEHPSPEERETLATIAMRQEDYPRAVEELTGLFESGGGTPERWYLLAAALVGAGELERLTSTTEKRLSTLASASGLIWPSPKSLGIPAYPPHLQDWLSYALLEAHARNRTPVK